CPVNGECSSSMSTFRRDRKARRYEPRTSSKQVHSPGRPPRPKPGINTTEMHRFRTENKDEYRENYHTRNRRRSVVTRKALPDDSALAKHHRSGQGWRNRVSGFSCQGGLA